VSEVKNGWAITGAGGFLGAEAVSHLARHPNHPHIHAQYSRPETVPERLPPNVTPLVGELTDLSLCARLVENCSAVLHLANRGFPSDRVASPQNIVSENLIATGTLLDAMRDRGLSRILYASSGGAIYREDPKRQVPFSESSPLEYRTPYALTKILTENLLEYTAKAKGLKPVILRLSNPYGPGQYARPRQGFVGVVFEKIWTGESFPVWGDLDTVKDFVYVEDVAAVFSHFLEDPELPAGIYNVASGTGVSLKEMITRIQTLTGRKLNLEFKERFPGDPTWTVLDTSLLQKTTGWKPLTSLDEGLQATWTTLTFKLQDKAA